MNAPLRCPSCSALVVSRRHPHCTTCLSPLPASWVMTQGQVKKVSKLDQAARAEHAATIKRGATGAPATSSTAESIGGLEALDAASDLLPDFFDFFNSP